jgi:hypothetical protein
MDTHGFALLPSLKLYDATVKPFRIPLPSKSDSHPDKLDFKALIQFEIPKNTNPHLQPTKQKSQPTSVTTSSKLPSTSKREDLYTQPKLPIFEQQQTTLLESNTTLLEWNIEEGIYQMSKAKKHIFLREKCIVSFSIFFSFSFLVYVFCFCFFLSFLFILINTNFDT